MSKTITFKDLKGNNYIFGGKNENIFTISMPVDIKADTVPLTVLFKDSGYKDLTISSETAEKLKKFAIQNKNLSQVFIKDKSETDITDKETKKILNQMNKYRRTDEDNETK